ncbi:MAG: glycosyltransferase [Bacteroidaceae bacterium]|nr:glycosyltransferase [Bacteroidaceae bacterium]
MKIGIIKSTPTISPTGGVRIQALMWKEGLEGLGHICHLINMWEENNWNSYDVIIVMEYGGNFRSWMKGLSLHNENIVFAPILDPAWGKKKYKFFAKYWGSHKWLGLTSRFRDLYDCAKYAKLYLTRSAQETEYLSYCCDIPKEKIIQVPLSLRFTPIPEMPTKENFCFHASRLCSANKNVTRLIQAAVKYKFPLVLAGYLHGEKEKKWLYDLIHEHVNIQYVGTITDDELCDYYLRAKVFALPSLTEGVGMVALEAAGYGCEVVLTNVGAPKDYFQGRATLVNPYSIDEIGQAVVSCLNVSKSQPELLQFIKDNYTIEACTKKLVKALKTI